MPQEEVPKTDAPNGDEKPAETGGAPAAEAPAEPAKEPSSEAQKPEEPKEPEAAKPATAPAKADKWALLLEALGEVPEEPNEKVLDGLDTKAIEKLPDEAKGALRHLLALRAKEKKDAEGVLAAERERIEAQKAELERDGRKLMASQAQFAAVFESPAMEQILKEATESTETIDPLTPEGHAKLVRIETAKHFVEFTKPVREAAATVRRAEAFHEFKATHPRMKEPAFLKDIKTLMEERNTAGRPATLAELHDLVEARWVLREDTARRDADRRARATSGQHVARETSESDPHAGGPIPDWVTQKGYKGETGTRAIVGYLRDHPKAKAEAFNTLRTH